MIDKLLMPKAYVEVLEIMKYIPVEDYNKIPYEIIKNMQLNMDKEYRFTVTHFNDFQKQEMLKETETILAVLFRDYWTTEENRNRILEKEKYDLKVSEEEKREKYNPDNIFKNKLEETVVENTNLPAEIKKETFFKKLISFIKGVFNKNN